MPSGSLSDELARTFTSGLRNEELEERRRATRAVLAAGVIAWPSFAVADLIATGQYGGSHVVWDTRLARVGRAIALLALAAVSSARG